MKRRFPLPRLFAAVATAMSAFTCGSIAAPLSDAALGLSSAAAPAPVKVQYACGWTYSCTDLNEAEVKKEEVWRVPEGAEPWTGREGESWRGTSCGGYPCTERCGAFCWLNRIRNGYCGHGCEAYREHVMFQPINGRLRPYIYRPDYDYGYGSGRPCGYARGSGYDCGSQGGPAQGGYGYRSGYGPVRQGYSETLIEERYDASASNRRRVPYYRNAPGESYGPPPERFIDRLRRYVYGPPRRETYGDGGYNRENGAVRFERPGNDLVPLKRFNGPKYPPN